MIKEVDIECSPAAAHDPELIKGIALQHVGRSHCEGHLVIRRSIDARRGKVKFRLRVRLFIDEPVTEFVVPSSVLPEVMDGEPVYIVGCGPAGLFAALQCVLQGQRPVILERGKDVRARRRDVARLNKEHMVNPESNYCFGEGGAGTFSDGKLYTRSHKRGRIEDILKWLVAFGASEDILIDAHPHIGTNRLPKVIQSMREAIENAGGDCRFSSKLTDLRIDEGRLRGIVINDTEELSCRKLVLATGHSARDIFHLLHRKGIQLESKDIAIGVRLEHPQGIIDRIQYRMAQRGEFLPPASYRVAEQVLGKGVYSFCMCPGGVIAPCATSPDEIVTNGWSPSKRNNPFANSGMVVQVERPSTHPLSTLELQSSLEKRAWELGGRTQTAPAQRLQDLINGTDSGKVGPCSYLPGVRPIPISEVLPERIMDPLRAGIEAIGKKLPGYISQEAMAVAVESRTSSPVRIPRDRTSFQHPQVTGLFPCGEGAGYAGGIVSAAMDGMKCAKACLIETSS